MDIRSFFGASSSTSASIASSSESEDSEAEYLEPSWYCFGRKKFLPDEDDQNTIEKSHWRE